MLCCESRCAEYNQTKTNNNHGCKSKETHGDFRRLSHTTHQFANWSQASREVGLVCSCCTSQTMLSVVSVKGVGIRPTTSTTFASQTLRINSNAPCINNLNAAKLQKPTPHTLEVLRDFHTSTSLFMPGKQILLILRSVVLWD